MVFETGSMHLRSVWEVLRGQVNDVVVCQETGEIQGSYHTVWVVKDHRVAKEVLTMMSEPGGICYESFTRGQNLCFLLPYDAERQLRRFYTVTAVSFTERSAIWRNYVEACLSAKIPYPLLYLIMEQEQVHVRLDGSIYFNYGIDLAKLDNSKQEAACAAVCAEELLELFAKEQDKNFFGYELISSKLEKSQCNDFIQLYQDVKLVIHTPRKIPLFKTLQKKARGRRDIIYRILLCGSFILLAAVIMMVVSQIIYGEIPLFRLFQPLFRTIGTESLLQ